MHRKQAWSRRVKKERFKKKYLTRMQATRLLQTDSMGFRRLCILKGIYPRAIGKSKQKLSGNEKQYYLTKEIKWLVRDHIQENFQAYQAWEKRVRRAKAMRLIQDLKLLNCKKGKPQYRLTATIKERYPFFMDAVKDIDDAMSMITLYAFLSPEIHSQTTIEFHKALPSGLHEKAKNVVSDWLRYVERAQVLTRGFISIKGYYYEALVKGERVRWLMPHEYASKFPSGIQQYILITFLEFYIEMMRFVLFKLNNDVDKELQEKETQEDATLQIGTTEVKNGSNNMGNDTHVESFETGALDNTNNKQAQIKQMLIRKELERVCNLFKGFVFYLSREVPFKHMHLVITSCGGRVLDTYGPGITHYVIDRIQPVAPHTVEPQIEYIQPQYLLDCLNARTVLPIVGYRMGETLPPHISPFTVAISNLPEDIAAVEEVKKLHPKVIGYIPQRVHEIRRYLDPTYNALDPEGKITELENELEEGEGGLEEVAHAVAPIMDEDDQVSLSGSDLENATREPEWEDEVVKEDVKRSKMSSYQVKKQRELNLMNQPTKESVALMRQQRVKSIEDKRNKESQDQRIKRKLTQKTKEDSTRRKMQLQVARKKAARYYKMINSVIQGNTKKEEILATKAKQLASGKIVVDQKAKEIVSARKAAAAMNKRNVQESKKLKKGANPYNKLPKWVR